MSSKLSDEYKRILAEKEAEIAKLVGQFEAKRFMGIFNGEAGSNTFEQLYLLGKKESS